MIEGIEAEHLLADKGYDSNAIVEGVLQPVVDALADMVAWVQQNEFTPAAKAEFSDAADGWVAAYASVHNATVVTLKHSMRT